MINPVYNTTPAIGKRFIASFCADLEVVGGGPCIPLIQLALKEQVGKIVACNLRKDLQGSKSGTNPRENTANGPAAKLKTHVLQGDDSVERVTAVSIIKEVTLCNGMELMFCMICPVLTY